MLSCCRQRSVGFPAAVGQLLNLVSGRCKMLKNIETSNLNQNYRLITTTLENKNQEQNHLKAQQLSIFFNGNPDEEEKKNVDQIEAEYKDVIGQLNKLQSNAESIFRGINNKSKKIDNYNAVVYLERSGLKLEDVERLSFIHIAGSKGKGTTCALTEALLRAQGVRTGFYSSPHLVSVTERIRINGVPISKPKFIKAFRQVLQRLEQEAVQAGNPGDLPGYFKFLTVLSLHIFLEEKVDVVILEVGIGGELDCTNIIRNTKTVGITSLGLEHTQLLGDTLEEIAWQKAGIIKRHSHVYTNATQPECLAVIRQRADEREATVQVVPDLCEYSLYADSKTITSFEKLNYVTRLNGSLALQLAHDWLRRHRSASWPMSQSIQQISQQELEVLSKCSWPGRCQKVTLRNLNFYLDGAHTVESMQVCSIWYNQSVKQSLNPKVLIFNITGHREAKQLLEILRFNNQFDTAYFVPNITSGSGNNMDNISIHSITEQIERARTHASHWNELCQQDGQLDTSKVCGSILDAFIQALEQYGVDQEIDILVTGSLHLVGSSVLSIEELQKRLCRQENINPFN